MRVVIYANDFEPITVVELAPWAFEYLERYGRVTLPVQPRTVTRLKPTDPISADLRYYLVRLCAERLVFGRGRETLLLRTADEEAALLLQSAFLPGQQAAVRGAERKAFTQGFLSALNALGE